jgi:hypothetical protein
MAQTVILLLMRKVLGRKWRRIWGSTPLAKWKVMRLRKWPVSVFRILYCDQENRPYRRGKVMRQDSSDDTWCLSPLQAVRGRFDEKLWRGKNASKFDKQHLEAIHIYASILPLYTHPLIPCRKSPCFKLWAWMKREEASRNDSGRLGEDESKVGARRPTGGISLRVQSNERKMSSRCVRRGWSNYPPCPMAVPLQVKQVEDVLLLHFKIYLCC